jgi:hypothetical protein
MQHEPKGPLYNPVPTAEEPGFKMCTECMPTRRKTVDSRNLIRFPIR